MILNIQDDVVREALIKEVRGACSTVGREQINAMVGKAAEGAAAKIVEKMLDNGMLHQIQRNVERMVASRIADAVRDNLNGILDRTLMDDAKLRAMINSAVHAKLEHLGSRMAVSIANAVLNQEASK